MNHLFDTGDKIIACVVDDYNKVGKAFEKFSNSQYHYSGWFPQVTDSGYMFIKQPNVIWFVESLEDMPKNAVEFKFQEKIGNMDNTDFGNIFDKYSNEAKSCLYPENNWTWGDKRKTLKLMNGILAEIPKEEFPLYAGAKKILKYGRWRLDLFLVDGKRSANLIYSGDDHTAWVVEGAKGKFVDFDIGGS